MRTTSTLELDLVGTDAAARGRFTAASSFMKTVWRVVRNRWAANGLHGLDDRQLDDIGLTRHDLMKATHGSGLFDDPAALLSESARLRAKSRFERLRTY
nr:hypothetical protein REQ54_02503 [Rhizobium sp. Q54]